MNIEKFIKGSLASPLGVFQQWTTIPFRSAFIVESVQIRISSSNRRKNLPFNVGDGIARYELPIWPELYEEKSHLLLENQLLYAVLQVDLRKNFLD